MKIIRWMLVGLFVSIFRLLNPFANLLVVSSGARKGKHASERIIASWLVKLIIMVYLARSLNPSAHQICGMASSWAAVARPSVESICRVESSSLSNTFISHYCIDCCIDYYIIEATSALE